MKNIDDFVSSIKENVKVVEKFNFERIDAVFEALMFAFYPDGYEDDLFDDRWKALWVLFLNAAGWTEDEYWDYWHEHEEHYVCDSCKGKQNTDPKSN